MAQFARMFDSWAVLTQYVFYILLVLLPLTAWRKQEKVGTVYGLLLLSVILHGTFDVLSFLCLFTDVLGSVQEALPHTVILAVADGIVDGALIFVLLLVGILYQRKRKQKIGRLVKWAAIVFVITAILCVIFNFSADARQRSMDLMQQIIMLKK